MIKMIFICLFLVSGHADVYANQQPIMKSNKMTIIGKVGNINKETVSIRTKSGTIKVPRSSIMAKDTDISPGKTVRAKVSWRQIYNKNY